MISPRIQRSLNIRTLSMASRRSSRLIVVQINESTPSTTTNEPASKGRKRKVAEQRDTEDHEQNGVPPVQSTPKRKRASKGAPPSTPTPAAAKLLGQPSRAGGGAATPNGISRTTSTRLADPHITNAPLLSPETSRIVANKRADAVSSPSKLGGQSKTTTTTTGNILDKACAHLIEKEPRLKPLIEKHHCAIFSAEGLAKEIDPFKALCSGIISQQVSGAAAKSIQAKFVALFNPDPPTPEDQQVFPQPSQVAATEIATLRTAGLSQRKAEYIQGLAEKFAAGELSTEMLLSAEYEEVLEKLIAVRGLGRWSVEMFACFGLKRMDVFSTGDLGVQRGLAAFMGRDVGKLKAKGGGKWKYMSEKDMLDISEKFAPYRSVFMWYMWRVEETDISTLEK